MKPFNPRMFPDEVTFYSHSSTTSLAGVSKRTFGVGEDMKASVQMAQLTREDSDGRVVTRTATMIYTPTDPGAVAGDKFVWRGRTYVVEGGTIPRGIGAVAFSTECQEVTDA